MRSPAPEPSSAPDWRIGTAGWSIPKSEGARFPEAGSHLARYGAVMNAAEINSSFYRPHRHTTYARWADSVPDDFRFAVKAPKTITHERRLRDCADLVRAFAQESDGLGPKRALVLVQLPPSLAFDPAVVQPFFALLRDALGPGLVCEPRHASWFDGKADALLAECGVARVAADPPPAPGADVPGGCPSFAYLRLHGAPHIYYTPYTDAQIALWRTRLRAAQARETWCIFDNTAAFAALPNALTLMNQIRHA